MGRKPDVVIDKKQMNIANMLSSAEAAGLYNIQGECGFGYIYDDGWIAVVMPTGVFRMSISKARKFSTDFSEVCEEISDLVERRILE